MCTPSEVTSPAATYSMTLVEQPHSGWIRKSAPGWAERVGSMSAGRGAAGGRGAPPPTRVPPPPRRGPLAGEAQGVADEVGHVLHLGDLVVVGEDHRVAPAGQLADLGLEGGDVLEGEEVHGRGLRRRDRSSAAALCVSAPMETNCMPTDAISRRDSSRTPPLASSAARPPTCATAARSSSTVMLSSRIRSAPAASAAAISAGVRHSTSSGRPGAPARARRTASPTPPATVPAGSLV